MKTILIAFLISLLIHLILFFNLKIDDNKYVQKKDTNKKTEIRYIKLEKKGPKILKEKIKTEKIEKIEKIEKKLTKKATEKVKKKEVKKQKKQAIRKKQTIKQKKKVKPLKKEFIPKNKQKPKEIKTLEDVLRENNFIDKKTLTMIEQLYGTEFQNFTSIQKAFIKNNINIFRQITQRVLNRLGYPPLAIDLRVSGTNIVEFIFHPNGDIDNLKITNSSGYKILDDYTIELIEIAYKDYPKPKTATKLKFYVHYRLY